MRRYCFNCKHHKDKPIRECWHPNNAVRDHGSGIFTYKRDPHAKNSDFMCRDYESKWYIKIKNYLNF